MNHRIVSLSSSIVAVLLLCVGVVGCSTTTPEQVEPEYISEEAETELEDEGLPFYATGSIAKIDGQFIGPGAFNDVVRERTERIPGGLPSEMIDNFKQQTVEFLIERHLVERVLEQQDIEVSEEDIDEAYDELRQRIGDDEDFEVRMEQLGFSDDDIRDSLEDDVELEKFLATRYDLDISEREVEQFYDNNRQQFQRREEVRARHILIEVGEHIDEREEQDALARAEEIYREASDGADFSELVTEYSEGPSADDGGDLGAFTREAMVERFSTEVFDELEVGEISEPVRTEFGFHIIEKMEHHDGGPADIEEVRSDIEMELKNQRLQEVFDDFVEELRAEADIEVFDEHIEVPGDDGGVPQANPQPGMEPMD